MPIYEYLCVDCGKRFEVLRTIKEADTPIACQNCQSTHTNRVLSVFFAQSDGHAIASNSSSCASCHATSCASCRGQ